MTNVTPCELRRCVTICDMGHRRSAWVRYTIVIFTILIPFVTNQLTNVQINSAIQYTGNGYIPCKGLAPAPTDCDFPAYHAKVQRPYLLPWLYFILWFNNQYRTYKIQNSKLFPFNLLMTLMTDDQEFRLKSYKMRILASIFRSCTFYRISKIY